MFDTLSGMIRGSAGPFCLRHLLMASPCTLGFQIAWWSQSNQTSLHGESDLQEQMFQLNQVESAWSSITQYRFCGTHLVEVLPKLRSKWRVHRQPCFKMTRVRWEDIKMLQESQRNAKSQEALKKVTSIWDEHCRLKSHRPQLAWLSG